jgi:Mg-chelatase subunit ChlD
MGAEEGALLEDYAAALSKLTGQNLGMFAEPWRRWYEEHKAELAEKGAKAAAAASAPVRAVQSKLHYYGIETPSKKVVFLLDISGSMKEPIGIEAAPVTGVKAEDQAYTGPKIEVAKRVLADAVRKLPKECTFNVIVFNHSVRPISEKMVHATDENKAKVALEIEDLQPAGSTWTYGALRQAFEIAKSTCTEEKFDPCVDTIFVLSDGAPTDDSIDEAKPMDGKQIVDAVAEWNQRMKIRIHTIAIDPRIGKGTFVRFMKDLAARNQGTYREIGAK